MAAEGIAAAGGGGANNDGKLAGIMRRQLAIQPLIYSDLFVGAQLIASNLATQDEMLGWFQKFQPTAELVDNLWRAMNTNETGLRWNKFLAGKVDPAMGFTKEMFVMNKPTWEMLNPMTPGDFMGQLYGRGGDNWMEDKGVKFIAQLLNALAQPLTDENRQTILSNLEAKFPPEKKQLIPMAKNALTSALNKAEMARDAAMKTYVAPNRGGKRSTSKRRVNKRRTSKRRTSKRRTSKRRIMHKRMTHRHSK
jgi:hypothetical protein